MVENKNILILLKNPYLGGAYAEPFKTMILEY